ncbi:MAG: GNAT family N-acetyltransferase [Ramlibacter sp.]|nr:GNAT family N-acetyltransferase [Ramlibacter sp.]
MIELRTEPVGDLRAYAAIPSSFEARSVLNVREQGSGFDLTELALAAPFRKNYDHLEDPLAWPRTFDTRRWVLLSALLASERVGGVIVAMDTPEIDLLEDRTDLAVLWDLRVAPAHRRRSVATTLLGAAQAWARGAGCTELKVETQNTNPVACRFYEHSGFVLSEVRPGAYRDLPDDVQLIWRKRLDGLQNPPPHGKAAQAGAGQSRRSCWSRRE